jgi:hypothetical protein
LRLPLQVVGPTIYKGNRKKRRVAITALTLSAAIAAIGLGSGSLYAQGKTVMVGILHSLSCTMAISEKVV